MLKLKSDALRGKTVAFTGTCSGLSEAAAATLARACGAIVHPTVQSTTDVLFHGSHSKRRINLDDYERARDFRQMGLPVAMIEGRHLRPILEGTESLDRLLHNPLLPVAPVDPTYPAGP